MAHFAFERPNVIMPFKMITEVTVGFELFPAALKGAFVRLFPCVDSVVDFQISLFIEGFPA